MDNENEDIKIIEAFKPEVEKSNNVITTESFDDYHKNLFTILIKILDSSMSQKSIEKIEIDLFDVKERYSRINIKSREVDMKIQEVSYYLMCKYLETRNIEKAKDFCANFGDAMKEYIISRIKCEMPNVIESNNYYAAMLKIDITEGVNLDVNNIKFWEGILNIEKPASNYRLPNEWQPLNSLVLRRRTALGLSISSYNCFGFFKVFKIHYDPRSEKNKMNQLDIQKLKEYLIRPKVIKNIWIVFEEGIEDVVLDLDNVNMLCDFTIKLPSTAKTIGGNLFRESINLSRVDLSNTRIEVIGDNTFLNSNLKKIKMPITLKNVGNSAFANCKNLKKVDFSNTDLRKISRSAFYNSGIKSVKLSNEIGAIDLEAFSNCKNLKQLDLSNTQINRIDSGFFANSGLEKVKLPESITALDFGAFSDCKNLKEVDLSKTKVRRIGAYAFFNSSVENVKLPNTVQKVEYEAFARCKNLKKIDFTKTRLDVVDAYAFYGSGVQDVKLPDELYKIDETAFNGCKNLKKINLP
ncbi:MAG: leucine-rich repeat domain-containing protein [Clostridia bacterium]|nr:leucine-rich repeat domain-containing protein [Clostridia bacterium]